MNTARQAAIKKPKQSVAQAAAEAKKQKERTSKTKEYQAIIMARNIDEFRSQLNDNTYSAYRVTEQLPTFRSLLEYGHVDLINRIFHFRLLKLKPVTFLERYGFFKKGSIKHEKFPDELEDNLALDEEVYVEEEEDGDKPDLEDCEEEEEETEPRPSQELLYLGDRIFQPLASGTSIVEIYQENLNCPIICDYVIRFYANLTNLQAGLLALPPK